MEGEQAPNQQQVAAAVAKLSTKLTGEQGLQIDVDAAPWRGVDLEYLGAPLVGGWTAADLVLWGGCALGLLLSALSALCCYALVARRHHSRR